MADLTVQQNVSPHAYAVLKESQEWGTNAKTVPGGVFLDDAVVKLHELLNKTIVALAQVEAELGRISR